jgi:hypothetical protein
MLGKGSAAAAALDGLLAAGDGDLSGGGGSLSTADSGRHRLNDCNCFFTVSELFVAVFSIWYLL